MTKRQTWDTTLGPLSNLLVSREPRRLSHLRGSVPIPLLWRFGDVRCGLKPCPHPCCRLPCSQLRALREISYRYGEGVSSVRAKWKEAAWILHLILTGCPVSFKVRRRRSPNRRVNSYFLTNPKWLSLIDSLTRADLKCWRYRSSHLCGDLVTSQYAYRGEVILTDRRLQSESWVQRSIAGHVNTIWPLRGSMLRTTRALHGLLRGSWSNSATYCS